MVRRRGGRNGPRGRGHGSRRRNIADIGPSPGSPPHPPGSPQQEEGIDVSVERPTPHISATAAEPQPQVPIPRLQEALGILAQALSNVMATPSSSQTTPRDKDKSFER